MVTNLKMYNYHSALKPPVESAGDITRVKYRNNIAFVHDIINCSFANEFCNCDLLYAEPPWRHGFEIFNDRAKVDDARTYPQFMNAIGDIIKSVLIPVVIIIGKHAVGYMPSPNEIISTNLNGYPALAYVYHTQLGVKCPNTEYLLSWLARRYSCVGDFCCGYGGTGRIFSRFGKSWVMSDYNPDCINYIESHMREWVDENI
jgi:hypothetical protein